MKLAAVLLDARKGITAALGAVGEALTLGLLNGSAERWATAAIAVGTALGVYTVRNGRKPTP